MDSNQINTIRKKTSERASIIHCITNPISINQCANAVLAVGCRPIMAEHPQEVEQITLTAGALLVNLGNITDIRIQSAEISAAAAKQHDIPTVVDAVGVACSQLRYDVVQRLCKCGTPSLIKGNYSEIMALCDCDYKAEGVDASPLLRTEILAEKAASLAKRHNAVVLASGKTDIVTDGTKTVYINNGTKQLSQVTGTGCMLGALCACYMSASDAFSAAVTACAVLGISGQLAETDRGNGSFMVGLQDSLSTICDADIENMLDIKEKTYE